MAGKSGGKAPSGGGDGGSTADAAAGGKKKKLIVIALGAVLLLGGGAGGTYMLVKPAAAAEEEHVEEVLVAGDVTALDPITLNLADGHYLKLGIALQATLAEAGGHGGGSGPDGSKALDLAIAEFSGLTTAELSDPAKRQQYKDALQEKIVKAYEEPAVEEGAHPHKVVMGIYFTQFVTQ
ncbi:flagellar basal body protein FliL [Kineococcus sp. R8]|uniref:flagellar basal body-associated FliL family protein n=1 Tax=Kineococcus siccus TaxID=2696567 RepID=UPI001412BCC9|nr:flagellar basal body-associated FliL family protein [Kineococcus siccus]NAZ84215.1 flagellar basal body protein FliL [Kineococcus siccus]